MKSVARQLVEALVKNAKGSVYYGMHFYPGVARYEEPDKAPLTIFLNEDTLREMDKSFEGKPVYVQHVDEVESNLDKLRTEADGWVIESFYNAADGKHWVKFIVCSEAGEEAIKRGFRLSNSYMPKNFATGGVWNGVRYDKQVTGGDYDHLALVANPRYEESIILSPDQFKRYNEEKDADLKRLNNEGSTMKFGFFKRSKVENSDELSSMIVTLPKSGSEVAIVKLLEDADEAAVKVKNGDPMMAHPKHLVKVGENTMSVKELVEKHNKMCDDMANAEGGAEEVKGEPEDGKSPEDKEKKSNEEDMEEDGGEGKKEKEKEEKKKNELAKAEAKAKADKLRNAGSHIVNEPVAPTRVYTSDDQVARGKTRYGS